MAPRGPTLPFEDGIVATAAAAFGANLTIGLGTDVTALDPHYHNVTPNNNVAAHIFGYLVQRNEKSQLEPGLATEWKTIDPLTWEFKLRRGVKFHDGSDFTAADVVASIERVPTVLNSPSPFTAFTKQIKEIAVVDPYTIRFRTATPYPLMPSDMLSSFDRALLRLNRWAVIAILAAMATMVFANVALRFLTDHSILWVEEVSRYLMLATAICTP